MSYPARAVNSAGRGEAKQRDASREEECTSRLSGVNSMQHERSTAGRNERFQVDVPDVNYELNKTELTRRVIALAAQFDRLANFAQGLPSRPEYEATLSDVDALQHQVAILFDVQKAQAQTINDLLAVVQTLHSRERAA